MIQVWRGMLEGTRLELDFNMGVLKFAQLYAGRSFDVAVGCAGTDIVRLVLAELFKQVSAIACLEARVGFVISAEISEAKRAFLLAQHAPSFLVSDNLHIKDVQARNWARGGKMQLVPCFNGFRIGIVCKSRTPLSSSKSENANCVQEQREETGNSFAQAESIIDIHRPDSVGIECVTGLREETAEVVHVHESDSKHIIASLTAMDYWAHDFYGDATEGGSPADRVRAWWVGLKRRRHIKDPAKLQQFEDRAKTFFTQLYLAFSRAEGTVAPEDCLLKNVTERAAFAEHCRVPLVTGSGIRVALTKAPADLKWKSDHSEWFLEHGLPWPFSKDDMAKDIHIDGLAERDVELAWFIHTVFDVAANCECEWIDINPDGARLSKPCFEWLEDEAGVVRKTVKKSPWHRRPRTLTGGAKMVVRYRLDRLDSRWAVRTLEPTEYMFLMGWGRSEWNPSVASNWCNALTPYPVGALCKHGWQRLVNVCLWPY